jgi:hypothetical protein
MTYARPTVAFVSYETTALAARSGARDIDRAGEKKIFR